MVQILEYRPIVPLKYRVVRQDGAKIRQGPELDSPEVIVCPFGTVLEVTEKRFQEGTSHGKDTQTTMRLKKLI